MRGFGDKVLALFGHKPKTNKSLELIMTVDEKLMDHQSYYNSSRGANECLPNFMVIQPIVRDTSVWTKDVGQHCQPSMANKI